MAAAAMVGFRPRPGRSLSPSRPLAAHRFLQRPIAKRLTPCCREISSWPSPWAKPKMILARKTSRWLLVLAVTMRWSSRCCSEVTSMGMAAGMMPTILPPCPYKIIFKGHYTSRGLAIGLRARPQFRQC
jgi:hypothetical protein